MLKTKRLIELDFLRGIAIILVLMRHQELFDFTTKMGWIGVDLFFVLSGYLVSGLLFREYIKHGDIHPGRFLIRRGFKIYPIYYVSFILYLLPKLGEERLSMFQTFSELIFIQNYTNGFGYINPVSWSLAVEEHFYFGFVLLLWLSLKYDWIKLKNASAKNFKVEISIAVLMIFCLILRCLSNEYIPNLLDRSFTLTHLRIDSLFAGVLVSYFYYFKIDVLKRIMNQKIVIWIIILGGVSWTPFVESHISFFAQTLGLTLLYISFSLLLIYFVMKENMKEKLNTVFSSFFVSIMSKIGYCSYSIYIFHMLVGKYIMRKIYHSTTYSPYYNHRLNFVVTSLIIILFGMIMTYTVEKMFLKIRDKYYPARQ